jgi:murein L,D-transpeptidase YcbB/YkuD
MRRHLLPLLLLSAASALAVPAAAQNAPPAPPRQSAPARLPSPILPPPIAIPAAPVAGHWSKQDGQDLLTFVEAIGGEGLNPDDYDPAGPRQALAGPDAALDLVATATFLKVESDLAFGHIRGDARIDWHVHDDPQTPVDQQALLDRALSGHDVPDILRSLLPTHPQYAALKAALASAEDKAMRDRIRLNLDRWRWLPRDLGEKYVIVNVPAYTVAIVADGQTLNRRRAVAGALKTPTPQLSALITGAIFNPWWEVPTSISHEVKGKKGYVAVPMGDGGVRYRQPPGPHNALGRMKLVMGNPYAIYLHDTNAKNLFNAQARAYSHGCVRTEDAVGFAETLLQGTDWDHEKIYGTVASGKTVQANLATPIPVYIVYFTIAATPDSPGYYSYKDMYGRDKPVVAALDNLPAPEPQEAGDAPAASARPKAPAIRTAKAPKPVKPAAASTSHPPAVAAVARPSTR